MYYGSAGYGYGAGDANFSNNCCYNNRGNSFALVLVLFILLVLIGCTCIG